MKSFATVVLLSILCCRVFAAEKPNIILIFADDISARELPVYGSSVWSPPTGGDTSDPRYRAQTPVLDKLAKEGCWITTTWAATVCSPSRSMMMTGRYAYRTKWWDNKDIGAAPAEDGSLRPWPLYESSPLLIGHVARKGGYATYWAGKTQMKGADLTRFGFDEGVFTGGEANCPDVPHNAFKIEMKKSGGQTGLVNADTGKPAQTYVQSSWYWWPHVALMNDPSASSQIVAWPNAAQPTKDYGLNAYGPDVELDFIFKFMERQHTQGKPFFIYHTTHLGHDAFNWINPASESNWPGTPIVHWDGKGYTRTAPNITGAAGVYDTHGTITDVGIHHHINYLDYQMWLYRKKLDEMGIADNTIIFFCADNGTWGYGKHSPDRQKGTHVPLIIHAPGMTKHGKQDIVVNLTDFLPTLADIVGTKIPSDYPIDGVSLWPYLMTTRQNHRDWIYSWCNHMQLIRGSHVLKDGRNGWWDVTVSPLDLISFKRISDWSSVPEVFRSERDRLQQILFRFDTFETEHDAPGIHVRPGGKKGDKNASKNQSTGAEQ